MMDEIIFSEVEIISSGDMKFEDEKFFLKGIQVFWSDGNIRRS